MGKRPKKSCGSCGATAPLSALVCGMCGEKFQEAVDAHVKQCRERVKQKALRQTDLFLEEFDGHFFEFAIRSLRKVDSLLVRELVELFRGEPIYTQWYKVFLKIPSATGEEFDDFVRSRVRKIAKWWHKKGVAFIGTDQTQGHPYRVYLADKAPENIKEGGMKIDDKAVWSVERIQQKILRRKQKPE